jgi:hypothetical protein
MPKPSAPLDSSASVPTRSRLHGWKEIAAYLDKGVRTVQRWEKELGLPVRRMGTGRAEVVFALPSEIDAWRQSAEKSADLAERPDEADPAAHPVGPRPAAGTPAPPAVGPLPRDTGRRPRLPRTPWLVVGLAFIVIVAALALAASWWFARGGEPYEARVERGALRVYDESGRFLWEHRFEFPLLQTPELRTSRDTPAIAVEDIDGDGHREVLLATGRERMDFAHGVYCFESRGAVRFRHTPRRSVAFGGIPSPGPWLPTQLMTTDEGGGGKAVWIVFVDRDQFPSVVDKIDARGGLLGEFWNPGTITCMLPATVGGRKVMLLGASNNESRGAALAVVDRANPTGTGPAVLPKFTCRGCPSQSPIAYLVMPGTRIEELQDNNTGVAAIHRGEQGVLTLVVHHSLAFERFGRGTGRIDGHTDYILSPELVPISAQHQPDFRVLHHEAFTRGVLDHEFGPGCDAMLFPLRRWTGSAFEPVRPPS